MQNGGSELTSANAAKRRPALRIRTLGGLGVERDGTPIESLAGQRKRLALLALLAVAEREPMAKDRLLASLWPESDVSQARNSLNQLAFALRRELGNDVILGGSGELRLNTALVGSDYADFLEAIEADDLETAVGCYRGAFLDGFYVKGTKEFEDWTDRHARQLATTYLSAVERLAERASQAGDRPRIVHWRRMLVVADPLSARFELALMEALVANDDREAAIRHGTSYLALVRAELDAEPDGGVANLLNRLRETANAPRAKAQPTEVASAEELSNGVLPAAAPGSFAHRRPALAAARSRVTYRVFAGAIAVGVLSAATLLAWQRGPRGGEVGVVRPPSSAMREPRATVPTDSSHAKTSGSTGKPISVDSTTAKTTRAGSRLGNGRVLVVGLQNETGDTALASVGTLAADWIAQGIQQTGMASVVDPLSTVALQRGRSDTAETLNGFPRAAVIARSAGADVVVWGSVYRRADSLLFQARISDVRGGKLLATIDPISSALSDPMTGATRLRGRVAGALAALADAAFASVESPSSAPTFEAYAEYMAGLALFQQFKVAEARRHFAAASALDTTFTIPLVWSALSLDPGETRERDSIVAILAARHDHSALESGALDYFRAEQRNDRSAMLIAARAAARLVPGSNWSFYAGSLALDQNRLHEAAAWFAEIDPEHGWVQGWPRYWESYMTTAHLLGDFETEAALARRGLAVGANAGSCRNHLLFAAIGRHRVAEANAALEEIDRASAGATSTANIVRLPATMSVQLAEEYRAHGFADKAAELLDRASNRLRSSEADDQVLAARDTARMRAIVRRLLGVALYDAGQYEESSNVFALLDSAFPEESRTYRGLIAARRGDRETAEAFVASLDSLAGDPFARAFDQGRILCVLGDAGGAMRKLAFAMTGMPRAFYGVHLSREWDAVSANIKTAYAPN
jgi:DNA-binding SARP family transcriptional activator